MTTVKWSTLKRAAEEEERAEDAQARVKEILKNTLTGEEAGMGDKDREGQIFSDV